MPRPNIPVRGGPHSPQSSGKAPDAGTGCSRCRELSAELDKVKQQAARAGRSDSGAGLPLRGSPLMVWTVLGACGMGLLFALLALIRHA